MTFSDMLKVEEDLAEAAHGVVDIRPPCFLSKVWDRVDIDVAKLQLDEAVLVQDRLAQELGRRGYVWDVWFPDAAHKTICVSEREVGE
jgi:hypothetical protein